MAEERTRRRWPRVGAALLAFVAVVGMAFWFLFVPNWRPRLRDGERYGVDVSSHQGEIDWSAVAHDDIEFAYIKATEGGDFVDERFATNWRRAADAGLERGAYHFFTLCRSGRAQALHFLRVAPPIEHALPSAVDLEIAGNCKSRPSAAMVLAEVRSFLSAVEQAWGQKMLLYVGDDWEQMYPTRKKLGRELWHARFLRRPNVDGWSVWQVHGFAHVDGVDGRVDLDVMRR